MRKLILERIEEFRKLNGNFSRSTMRWQKFTCGENNTHISVYNFDACDDENLLLIFEKLVRTHYKQM